MTKAALLLAGTAMVIASPAAARDDQFYIGLGAGVSLEDQVDIDGFQSDPEQNIAIADTNMGIDTELTFGYDFGAFRLEAEGSWKRAGYEALTVLDSSILPGGVTVPAGTVVENERDLEIFSGMINGLFEFGKDDGVTFFVGGGAGLAEINLPVEVAGVGTVVDDDAVHFAWQGIAGLRFAVSDSVDLGLKYRYFDTDNVGLTATNGEPFEVDYNAHSILATLNYNFGGRSEPAPAPAPAPAPVVAPPPPPPVVSAPPPAPRPVCNTGPYIVFFDFDSSDITAEAATILNNAVTAYGNCGSARVMLAGHTDTSGGAQYNMGLAERRNAAVRSYMTGRGVAAGAIMSEAFGETRTRVPTADGVREAQNRRVEVTYGPGSGM